VRGFVPTVQAATDASVTLGSGSGALTVTNSTNTITSLGKGLTVSLQGADPNTTVNVTVASDTSSSSQAIQDFVTSYNDLLPNISQQTSYDPSTSTAGPLLGNVQATQIQQKVAQAVTGAVHGSSGLISLSTIGITTDQNGQLQVDQNKLTQALSGQIS